MFRPYVYDIRFSTLNIKDPEMIYRDHRDLTLIKEKQFLFSIPAASLFEP